MLTSKPMPHMFEPTSVSFTTRQESHLVRSPALGFMVRPDIDVTFVGTELDRRVVSLR